MKNLIWLLLLCCVSTSIVAQELVVGVENIRYYPIYDVQNGQYRGYARELIDAFAKQYGHTVVYKPFPVKRLVNEYLEGHVDFKFPDNKYWAQDEKKGKTIIYSEPALEYIDGTLVIPARMGKSMAMLKKLGTIRGFTPWEYLGDISAGKVKVQESNNISNLMKMVQLNRVDAVYFNVQAARYYLKHSEYPADLVQYDRSLPHTRDFYHLSSIKYPNIISQFNEFLSKQSKLVAELRKKYELDL